MKEMKENMPILCKWGFHAWVEARMITEMRRTCRRKGCKTKQRNINGKWTTVNSFVFGSYEWDDPE